jgi:N-acylneuraminate cytidylyltransferase
MIDWTIQAARLSGVFSKILVSTDDDEIARIATASGADVPFRRPCILADDHTGTVPVVAHAIQRLEEEGHRPSLVCCLYATAPFLQAEDIRRGLEAMGPTTDYAFSVTSYGFPIQRAVRINATGLVEMFDPTMFNVRSQDLEPAYHDAAQFYWGQREAWLDGKPVFTSRSVPILLPRARVQDIDTLEDWERAEWLFKAMQSGIS